MSAAHLRLDTSSEDQTIALGESLALLLRPGDVLGLDGDLGAGKTRLVRGLAAGLGVDPAGVSSPTNVLIHEYRPTREPLNRHVGVGTPVFHVDAYRLSGPQDLDALGWDRVVDALGVTLIEWFERIRDAEPAAARVRIEATGPHTRRVDLLVPHAWTLREQWPALARRAHAHTHSAGPESPGPESPGPESATLPPGWARCPVTGRPVPPGTPTFPFADQRARMADLGKWLSGAYRVGRDLTDEDLDDAATDAPDDQGQGGTRA
jgi:tRNA threonylcarbamoyladenosine biosynthesis protein TsaE